ncbi:MAG: RluA family pseudouridine synthase [Planctomycetota bacterium]
MAERRTDIPPSTREHLAPTPGLDIELIHAEDTFVVINKPAGMLSVPGRGEDKADCARVRVQDRFPDATGPMTCHRLDMDTSGLLVLALDPETHKKLSGQFEKRRVRKWYAALLDCREAGPLEMRKDLVLGSEQRRIDLAHCVDWVNRPLQKIDWANGKHARTDATLIDHEQWTTPSGEAIPVARVEMRPITGRTHQLRVATVTPERITGPAGLNVSGGLGRPIVGDRLYGDERLAPRLLLHAEKLGFWHPWHGEWQKFEAKAPF